RKDSPVLAQQRQRVIAQMKPYLRYSADDQQRSLRQQLARAIDEDARQPVGTERFLQLAESIFAAQRPRSATSDVADELNGFYKRWQDGGRFGEQIGCVIRAATNCEKIGLADVA